MAVSEKNNVNEQVYTAYATENGLLISLLVQMIDLSSDIVNELDEVMNEEFNNEANIQCDYYSTKWEKIKEDSKITIRNSLTINPEADFSKMIEKVESENISVTKENADYSITLKVGETYNLNLSEKCTGFSLMGSSCAEIDKETGIVTGTKIGICYGTLLFGNAGYTYTDIDGNTHTEEGNQTKKTIYVEVVEGVFEEDTQQEEAKQEENKDTSENKVQNNSNSNNLPQTGTKDNHILIGIFICIINIIFIKIKSEKISTK